MANTVGMKRIQGGLVLLVGVGLLGLGAPASAGVAPSGQAEVTGASVQSAVPKKCKKIKKRANKASRADKAGQARKLQRKYRRCKVKAEVAAGGTVSLPPAEALPSANG